MKVNKKHCAHEYNKVYTAQQDAVILRYEEFMLYVHLYMYCTVQYALYAVFES
jgi:hypothetical protein